MLCSPSLQAVIVYPVAINKQACLNGLNAAESIDSHTLAHVVAYLRARFLTERFPAGADLRQGLSALVGGAGPGVAAAPGGMPMPLPGPDQGYPGGANPGLWPMQAQPGMFSSQGAPMQRPNSGRVQ